MQTRRLFIIFTAVLLIFCIVPSLFSQSTATGSGRGRGAAKYQLTVRSNVSNASIYINGTQQKGSPTFTTELEEGNYRVTLSAPGYYDASQQVNLNGNQTIRINLQPVNYKLTVTSNVNGASVFINGNQQKGSIPYHTQLPPGTYNITIKADGYFDGNATVNLNKNQSVHINLQPAMATIVPTKPHPDFKVFVDGRQIFEPEMVQPGEHTIQYSIGALQTQSTFYLEAGQTYRIEPVLSINFGY